MTTLERYPLSCSQQDWCRTGETGSFGHRFVLAMALRVRGHVDVAALQGALNDLVERHEMLRSVVVREAESPYQVVHAATPVPLEIRDLTPDGRPREAVGEELLIQAQSSSLPVLELPLLRATLARFDDADAVLTIVTHHSACDGWSMQLLKRDLAACYAARVSGEPARLAEPRQYREWAAWQQESAHGTPANRAREYWRKKLHGAKVFALPTDRPIPKAYQSPYQARNFSLDGQLMDAVNALAAATRSSPFTIVLATFNVLANRITGTTDPVINTITAGRSAQAFRDTVGLFLNFLPLRTDISGCETFRDIVTRTRKTCLEAFSAEIPILVVERDNPGLMTPLADPHNCDFVFVFARPAFRDSEVRIADGTSQITLLEEESADLPGGAAWTLAVLASGGALGKVQYNPDVFDAETINGWVEAYRTLLADVTAEPDRSWRSYQ